MVCIKETTNRPIRTARDRGVIMYLNEHAKIPSRAADYVIDMWVPAPVSLRVTLVAAGTPEEIIKNPDSITGAYLTGKKQIRLPETRRKPGRGKIDYRSGANNL